VPKERDHALECLRGLEEEGMPGARKAVVMRVREEPCTGLDLLG
jgi:hypothetical protein